MKGRHTQFIFVLLVNGGKIDGVDVLQTKKPNVQYFFNHGGVQVLHVRFRGSFGPSFGQFALCKVAQDTGVERAGFHGWAGVVLSSVRRCASLVGGHVPFMARVTLGLANDLPNDLPNVCNCLSVVVPALFVCGNAMLHSKSHDYCSR